MPTITDYAALAATPATSHPRTVAGLLLNYRQTLESLGDAVNQPPYKAPPRFPVLYIKPANTYAEADQAITLPADVEEVEVGACLAVEFARSATRVTPEQALNQIAGYRVVADLSVPHASFYRPPMKYKNRDGFCPISRTLTPVSAVSNPDALEILVSVDGQVVQRASTTDLVRSVARAIADVTEFMTLHQGDLLLLGIPHGAPRARAGQSIQIDIAGVGSLTNALVAA